MLDQFHLICHSYIIDATDTIVNGHCINKCIASLLGMGEGSWLLIWHDLFKELSQWCSQAKWMLVLQTSHELFVMSHSAFLG